MSRTVGDWWIHFTKGQYCRKRFYVMMPSFYNSKITDMDDNQIKIPLHEKLVEPVLMSPTHKYEGTFIVNYVHWFSVVMS